MWIWVIIIGAIIGAIIGLCCNDGDAASGAAAGGCMAAGCLIRIALAAIGILIILWLFGVLFG